MNKVRTRSDEFFLAKAQDLEKETRRGSNCVDRASQVIYPGLISKDNPIKKQVSRAWSIFRKSINKYEDAAKSTARTPNI